MALAARVIDHVEPEVMLRSFMLSTKLYCEDIPDGGSGLQLLINLRSTSQELQILHPICSMIRYIQICKGQAAVREYQGEALYLLSYLGLSPDGTLAIDPNVTIQTCAALPLVRIEKSDTTIIVAFLENIDPHIFIDMIELHSLPTKMRTNLHYSCYTTCLAPGSLFVTKLLDIQVMCALVWRGNCKANTVQLSLRDSEKQVCGPEEWMGEDITGTSDCVYVCTLPLLNILPPLILNVRGIGKEIIPKIKMDWCILHAPTSEGWHILQTLGSEVGNGMRGGWGGYLKSWWRRE